MARADGLELFGAWVLILQIAAKCKERWLLAEDDGPLTAEDMALKTGAPVASFAKALDVLTDPRFGWIEKGSM